MKNVQRTLHWGLIVEELVCLFGVGIGLFGFWYDSAVILSAIVLGVSVLCAIVLFVTQYHAVVYTENELIVRYFGGSLRAAYASLGEVKASSLFPIRFPLTVYYTVAFPKGGKRFFYMDGEILATKKQKHLMLAHGVTINDPRDTATESEATSEVRRAEHRVRDVAIKAARAEGKETPLFGYEAYGAFSTFRPLVSYRFVARTDEGVRPLLSVKKSGKKYTYKEL